MDVKQFRELIVRPTLKLMDKYVPGMYSEAAENLLVGTALVESDLAYVKQHSGPALSMYQIEPDTELDIMHRYINESKYSDDFWEMLYAGNYDSVELNSTLIYDMRYATIVARLRYFMETDPLPDADDIHALGHYWNTHYNANPDFGTVADFENKYRNAHK